MESELQPSPATPHLAAATFSNLNMSHSHPLPPAMASKPRQPLPATHPPSRMPHSSAAESGFDWQSSVTDGPGDEVPFRFLELPLELREEVYGHTFYLHGTGSTRFKIQEITCGLGGRRMLVDFTESTRFEGHMEVSMGPLKHVPFIRTCSQVKAEYLNKFDRHHRQEETHAEFRLDYPVLPRGVTILDSLSSGSIDFLGQAQSVAMTLDIQPHDAILGLDSWKLNQSIHKIIEVLMPKNHSTCATTKPRGVRFGGWQQFIVNFKFPASCSELLHSNKRDVLVGCGGLVWGYGRAPRLHLADLVFIRIIVGEEVFETRVEVNDSGPMSIRQRQINVIEYTEEIVKTLNENRTG